MQIQLFDVSSFDGKSIHVTAELEMNEISFRMGSFPIISKEPFELTVTNTGNKVLEVTGEGSITVQIPCDRCLENVDVQIPFVVDRKLDMKLANEERQEDLEEQAYLNGMDLDVDQLVRLEVLMGWPLKVLCREDCKGICDRCGKNLNDGACDCDDSPKDPRMAAISDIFRKFKEEV
jgi:uncharacterized protein